MESKQRVRYALTPESVLNVAIFLDPATKLIINSFLSETMFQVRKKKQENKKTENRKKRKIRGYKSSFYQSRCETEPAHFPANTHEMLLNICVVIIDVFYDRASLHNYCTSMAALVWRFDTQTKAILALTAID